MAHYARLYLGDETVLKAAKESLTRPCDFGYFGDLPLFESWGITFSQTRDSDTVERSNYRTILRDLQDMAATVTDDPSEYVQELHTSHWLTGWMDHIVVKVLRDDDPDTVEILFDGDPVKPSNITTVFQYAAEIAVALNESYPIYDESDHSELESEEDWERFTDSWSTVCRGWDADEDGPEPTDEEQTAVHQLLTEQETPIGYWHEEIAEVLQMARAGTHTGLQWLDKYVTPESWTDPTRQREELDRATRREELIQQERDREEHEDQQRAMFEDDAWPGYVERYGLPPWFCRNESGSASTVFQCLLRNGDEMTVDAIKTEIVRQSVNAAYASLGGVTP